jgi:endonuclease/exonuclease/phosphatase family metal-dependent hydrolase
MLDRRHTLPKTLAAALRKRAPHFVKVGGDDPCTTIASYNVHKCVGTDGRFDPARTAAVVAELDADIVALQEADERLGERVGLLDLEALAKSTELVPLHMPQGSRSHGWHGNLLLARSGVVQEVRTIHLPGLEPRGALIVDLEIKGVHLRIIGAHFGLFRHSRKRQANAVLEAAQGVIRPTIILGDLNEWRVSTRSSLLSLLPHFGPLNAVLPSFPSRFPLLALDRILARPQSMISSIEVHHSPLARVASDHLPVKARLKLEGLAAETVRDAA